MWNPFKTKKRFIGIKLFISEDLDSEKKMKIVLDFFLNFNKVEKLNTNFTFFHDVKNYEFKDDATVFFARFKKTKNWYGEDHFMKKYHTSIEAAWKLAEEKNFMWDKFDVDVYPVIE